MYEFCYAMHTHGTFFEMSVKNHKINVMLLSHDKKIYHTHCI